METSVSRQIGFWSMRCLTQAGVSMCSRSKGFDGAAGSRWASSLAAPC